MKSKIVLLASLVALSLFGYGMAQVGPDQQGGFPGGGHPPVAGYGRMGGPRGHDPEVAKLHQQDQQLAQQVRSVLRDYMVKEDAEGRAKVRDKLQELLGKQFDAQHQRREMELRRIEERVKRLRATMQKRNDARKEIIASRLDQLVREAEGLGWNEPNGGGNFGFPGAFGGPGAGGGGIFSSPVPLDKVNAPERLPPQ